MSLDPTNIKPIKNLVLIRHLESVKQTESGIILTKEQITNPLERKSEVIAIGPDVTDVKVGEIVSYAVMEGTKSMKIPTNKGHYFMINQDELVFVWE